MKKVIKGAVVVGLLAALVWTGTLVAERLKLTEELIRLHVVADSDQADAQSEKLLVRDAVLASLRQGMADATDMEAAKAYITDHLDDLEQAANQALATAGSDHTALVALLEEAFPTRVYGTFSLPAGVYTSLRITIGSGQGHNWWCVVFPELCLPTTAEGFSEAAEAGGFPSSLTGALAGEEEYQVRFYLLDLLGRLENFFYSRKIGT